MKKTSLSKEEKAIEKALIDGEYGATNQSEFDSIVCAIHQRKKDTVLNLRVNSEDLNRIKEKAKRRGVAYQSLLSELIHRFAM